MQIELNRQSQIPLVTQIYQAIADRILSGYFAPGGRLPSVRQLAHSISVSPVTVVQAYKRLEQKGLIERIQGKGTFVSGEAPIDSHRERHSTNNALGARHSDMAPDDRLPVQVADYLHRSQSLRYHQTDAAANFALSVVNPRLLPTDYLAQNISHTVLHHPEALAAYGEIQGDLQLRQAMADYLQSQSVEARAAEVLIANGSQQAIDLVARSFLGPGDIVVAEEPTYTEAIDVFRGRGATVIPVPVDDDGMQVDHLIRLCDTYTPKLIYTVPTFQNPTGTVLSFRRRLQLLDLAQSMNCIIVEDDPWSEMYFEQTPPPHIKSLDRSGSTIYIKGLSKILAPGCRIAAIVASGNVFNRLLVAKTLTDLGSPLLTQKAILPLMQSKNVFSQLARLREHLKRRRDTTLASLERYAPPEVKWHTPSGGFNIWLSFPTWVNTNDLLLKAEASDISFLPGSTCYPGELQFNHLRLSFSYVHEKELQTGIKRLCELIAAHISELDQRGRTPQF